MNTKLTLKMNEKAIRKAKKIALKNNQSLSKIVENYFEIISKDTANDKFEISPNVLELLGVIKIPTNVNEKQEYGKHLVEKYIK